MRFKILFPFMTSTLSSDAIQRYQHKFGRRLRERAIATVLFLAAFSSVATMTAILYFLVRESVLFFQEVSLWEFISTTRWEPEFTDDPAFGIWSLLSGTLTTSAIALSIAIPMGSVSAIYLSEYAPPQLREVVKPILELLAGIPTVVYGYFALRVITPALREFYPDLPIFNMLSAGLAMGIMIVPFISSISEDAMRAVPTELREGSYAMGATRLQTALRVVFPAAISGVSSAYILGMSRAVGETMIVAVAAGGARLFTFNPTQSAETITSYIVHTSQGDLPQGTLGFYAIFAAGLTLIVMTLVLNIIGHFLARRYREIY